MAAVIALPGVPAIFFSHAGVRSVPIPRHPRIYRYAAMSPALATRLVVESAIEESAMNVVLNTVDLTRFTKVRRPPPPPAPALYNNSDHGPNGPLTIAIEKAANAAGLTLDCIGHRFGRVLERPQQALLDYDIVFTAGKSALDAMACGAAVITVGLTSCGELVGPDNFDRLRRANFSVGVNSVPPSPDGIHAEIGRYTPEGCAVVTARVREEADGELMILQMEEIYRKAIAAHAASTPDHLAEQRAVARYFRELVPLISLVHETTTGAGIAPMTGASARHLASAQVSALENGGYASAEQCRALRAALETTMAGTNPTVVRSDPST
jgi:hypothetical protein